MNADTVHYQTMKVQPIDAMRAWLSAEQLTGFFLGNAIKYLARFNAKAPGKGGLSDLRKAREYLDWLIQIEESA